MFPCFIASLYTKVQILTLTLKLCCIQTLLHNQYRSDFYFDDVLSPVLKLLSQCHNTIMTCYIPLSLKLEPVCSQKMLLDNVIQTCLETKVTSAQQCKNSPRRSVCLCCCELRHPTAHLGQSPGSCLHPQSRAANVSLFFLLFPEDGARQ